MVASRPRTLMLAVLVLAAGLAGCAGSETPDGTDGDETPADDQPKAEIPRWELGDAWTYSIKTDSFPRTETTLLYYGTDGVNCVEDGQNYCVGVTDQKQAMIHTLFNVNPQLGRIQKGNLAVFEDGKPRAMYDFPITDGKTWQTGFFVSQHGGTLNAEATYSESIETGIGTMEGFEITATNSAGFEVVYDYIPEIQWFSKLVVTDSDGSQLHDLQLVDFKAGSSGTGYFVRGEDLHDATYEDCGVGGCSDTVLVDGESAEDGEYGAFDLVAYNVRVNVTSGNDRAQIQISDGDGNEIYSRQFLQDQQNEFKFEIVRDFAPGDWDIDVSTSGDPIVKVRLAGGWSYSGTV